jgi:hypothetical protein
MQLLATDTDAGFAGVGSRRSLESATRSKSSCCGSSRSGLRSGVEAAGIEPAQDFSRSRDRRIPVDPRVGSISRTSSRRRQSVYARWSGVVAPRPPAGRERLCPPCRCRSRPRFPRGRWCATDSTAAATASAIGRRTHRRQPAQVPRRGDCLHRTTPARRQERGRGDPLPQALPRPLNLRLLEATAVAA